MKETKETVLEKLKQRTPFDVIEKHLEELKEGM